MSSSHKAPVGNAGSAIYTGSVLNLYDFWVLWLSNTYAWLCPTATVQLPLYRSAMGKRHMDIGVGTGYYPSAALSPLCEHITLVDLAPKAMETAKARILNSSGGRVTVDSVHADAREELPIKEMYDSISMFFLLHCMPGPAPDKTRAFDVARRHLKQDGELVGTTILGRAKGGLPENWFARFLLWLYNRKGVFDNGDDDAETFADGLERNFGEVQAWTVGRVLLFRARKPKS